MTLKEMKIKVLGLIEELNPLSALLTDDPDIAAKINEVINQIMFEMARFKKIPKYVEMEVKEGDILDLAVKIGAVDKSGAWYAYDGNKIGQGRENAKQYLKDNPAICAEISDKVRTHFGLTGSNAVNAAVANED
mgnify:CR=1 FL=1